MRWRSRLLSCAAVLAALSLPGVSAFAGDPCADLAMTDPAPDTWNLAPTVAPWLGKLESGQQASLMIIGDSISVRADSYNWFLVKRLRERYGDAGDGYFGLGSGFTAPNPAIDTRLAARYPQRLVRSESHTRIALLNHPREEPRGTWAPDGLFGIMWDDGWLEADFHGTRARLYYIKRPGGGILKLTLNGQPLAELYTQANQISTGVFEFETGAPDNDTISTLRMAPKYGREMEVLGLEMMSDDHGLIYHRIGRGGQGPDDFLRSVNKGVRRIYENLNPDLVIVMLDWAGGDDAKAAYADDLNELLDFYQYCMPDSRFVLMSHHPFQADIAEQVPVLLQIACERNLGFINLQNTFPDLEAMEALGFIEDGVHFTAAGGQWFGDYVYDLLMGTAEACRADVNGDGRIDFADLNELLDTWGEDDRADVDGSGLVDFPDLNMMLDAWGACE
ncbi:MAG: hypothetical protein KDA21_09225 [Phycisphaerales bacterium]|nr:hypothetical protein [Phycisphaerales bacterium]